MIYRRVSFICAVLTTVLGALTLVGWVSGLEALASLRKDYIPMAPSTALAFAILGGFILLRNAALLRPPLAFFLLGSVAIVAAGKLWEFFSGISLGVELLLVADPAMFGAVRKGLFTDGLFEVEDPLGNLYTQGDLLQSVGQLSSLPASELLDRVLSKVRAFAGRPDFEDDVCVIGVEVTRRLPGVVDVVAPEAAVYPVS